MQENAAHAEDRPVPRFFTLESLKTYVGFLARDVVETRGDVRVVKTDLFELLPVRAPIPMRLFCERCHAQHIDKGRFETHPHHTHSCQSCGLTWRPAVPCTVGVQFLPGFKDPEA